MDGTAMGDRYDRVAITLHWMIGLALIGQLVFGFMLDGLAPRGTPSRAVVVNLHKSFGLVLLALVAVRVAWRLRGGRTAVQVVRTRAVRIGHAALYAGMAMLPLTGYIASNFSRHGVKFFGTPLPPWGADLPVVYALFNGGHRALALLFTALVLGHVLMALKHTLVDRDGSLSRMWPSRRHGALT